MEGVSEPSVKHEREDSVCPDTEYEGKGTHSIENPPENIIYIKDSLHIKDEHEEISDCIKKEIKDEVEVGFEEWGESETGESDCFLGCVEGNLTEVGQISPMCTGMPEVFQKLKDETQDIAQFIDLALEAGLGVAEGETVKTEEEEWCQVESSHTSSVEMKLEHIRQETAVLDPMAKNPSEGPNTTEDPGTNPKNKSDSAELKEVLYGRNNFDQLSTKIFYRSNLNQHSPANSKESQCIYNHCSHVTSNADDFSISSMTQNKEGEFDCDRCSYKTNCRSDFTKHCLFHNNLGKFACDQCSYKTNDEGSLTMYCLDPYSIKKFACDQCPYKTNDKSNFTKHCRNHSNIKQFACDQCSYKTNRKASFNVHCLNHNNIKKFACDQCSYKTNYISTFTQHCLNHRGIKKFACDQCSLKTNNKGYFNRHYVNHSNASIKKFACDECSYMTNDKCHLTRHCLNHSSIKKYVCDQCSYKTNRRSVFTKHCVKHSNVKHFTCDQ